VSRRPNWAELWWTEFELAGRRPALVLTRPEAAERVPRLLVAPATTTIRNLPSEVHLDVEDGVPLPCVLDMDTPELVPRHALIEYIATLSAPRFADVCAAMGRAINC
jgi:mRNA interferase MazF